MGVNIISLAARSIDHSFFLFPFSKLIIPPLSHIYTAHLVLKHFALDTLHIKLLRLTKKRKTKEAFLTPVKKVYERVLACVTYTSMQRVDPRSTRPCASNVQHLHVQKGKN